LFGLKLQLAQVTDARRDFDFGHYLALTILISTATVVTIGVVAFSIYPFDTAIVMAVLGAEYAVMAFRYLFLAVMQKAERMDKTVFSQFLTGTLSITLFGVIFWATRNLALGMVGLLISRIITLFAYDYPVAIKLLKADGYNKDIVPCWQMDKLWALVKLTAPLGLVAWVGTFFTSIPRLALDKFAGRGDVGYFVTISTLLVLGNMLMSALGQSTSPRMAKYYLENRQGYKLLVLKLTGIAGLTGILGVLISITFGKVILRLLFTPEYAEHSWLFTQLMVAGTFLFLFASMNTALTAARKFFVQLPIYAFSALVCGISVFALIPRYGMSGAAWSLLICYCTGFAGCLFFVVLVARKS